MRNSPNKHGETKYRYYEKIGKQSQKEAQKRLNEMSVQKAKLNDKIPNKLSH